MQPALSPDPGAPGILQIDAVEFALDRFRSRQLFHVGRDDNCSGAFAYLRRPSMFKRRLSTVHRHALGKHTTCAVDDRNWK